MNHRGTETQREGSARSTMLGESGYARRAHDAYFTEPWCTRALIDAVAFPTPIWEPACGDGAISKELIAAYGADAVVSSDIKDYGWPCGLQSFFDPPDPDPQRCRAIVTNPPYDQAEAFIRRALELTRPCGGKVAMLLRHEFDCASGRQDLFDAPPFALRIVLTRRPRWSDSDKASPRHNFAWYVWDWAHKGPAVLKYRPRRQRGLFAAPAVA